MEMTAREYRALGWVYCKVKLATEHSETTQAGYNACMYPFRTLTSAINKANIEGALTPDLQRVITPVMAEVQHCPDPGTTETVPSLEMQGAWFLGFYHAMAGKDFK